MKFFWENTVVDIRVMNHNKSQITGLHKTQETRTGIFRKDASKKNQ